MIPRRIILENTPNGALASGHLANTRMLLSGWSVQH